jgi:hypothetical protein
MAIMSKCTCITTKKTTKIIMKKKLGNEMPVCVVFIFVYYENGLLGDEIDEHFSGLIDVFASFANDGKVMDKELQWHFFFFFFLDVI